MIDLQRHFIYLIEHPAGYWYVGLTGNPVSHRWSQHKHTALRGRGSELHRTIRLLGLDGFTIRELGRYKNRREASEAEKSWLSQLKEERPTGNLNRTAGGAGTVAGRATSRPRPIPPLDELPSPMDLRRTMALLCRKSPKLARFYADEIRWRLAKRDAVSK